MDSARHKFCKTLDELPECWRRFAKHASAMLVEVYKFDPGRADDQGTIAAFDLMRRTGLHATVMNEIEDAAT